MKAPSRGCPDQGLPGALWGEPNSPILQMGKRRPRGWMGVRPGTRSPGAGRGPSLFPGLHFLTHRMLGR